MKKGDKLLNRQNWWRGEIDSISDTEVSVIRYGAPGVLRMPKGQFDRHCELTSQPAVKAKTIPKKPKQAEPQAKKTAKPVADKVADQQQNKPD